jgi:hypothetical protein
VAAGDTLQTIAKGAYGDANLWYLIADANGLSSNGDLRAGQVLTIPTAVGSANSANTFRPYDPSKITGNTSPTLMAQPQDKGGCGAIGTIIVVVVAVVVAYFTAGAAAGALAPYLGTGAAAVGGTAGVSVATAVTASAIGGAVGSIASQAVGVAIGAQESFSWKGVALAAVGGGVGYGLGGMTGPSGNAFVDGAIRGAVGSAATQGIAVVTGLQSSFSWRSVAASAVSAGVGQGINEAMGYSPGTSGNFEFGKSLVSGLASSAIGQAVRGGKVNAATLASDVFGNVIGDALARGSVSGGAAAARAPMLGSSGWELQPGQGYGYGGDANGITNWPANVAAQADASAAQILFGDPGLRPTTGYDYSGSGGGITGWQPGPSTVLAGDYGGSMERVARSELGAGASQREVNNYVGQLFELNGITNPRAISGDMQIMLPGANTPAATGGLAMYGKDIALGEQLKMQGQPQAPTDAAQVARYDENYSNEGRGLAQEITRSQAGTPGSTRASVDPFSLVTPDYYVAPGAVARYYQGQVALFSDSSQPWYVRSLSFANATLASPLMLLEEGGRGIMNVPYAGSQVGQHAAVFNQSSDFDTRVVAGLSMLKFGSEGIVNAYAGGVLGRQVYVQAQDEAVSFWLKQQFDGDIRKFNEVYTSAVDGTRRLGYSLDGVTGYRAHNNEVMATQAGEFMSLERPASAASAIENNALRPNWGNQATELYSVTTRSGFYFKGKVAPQNGWYKGDYFSLSGGNTQIFLPALPNPAGGYPIAPWVRGERLTYGQ